MNVWLIAATALLFGLVGCGWVVHRGSVTDAVAAFELTGTVTVLVLMLLSEGFGQTTFMDLALVLAFLTFAGGLIFVRHLERWG